MSQKRTPPSSPPPNVKSAPKKEPEKREIKREDKRPKDTTRQKPPPITEHSTAPQKDIQNKESQKSASSSQSEQTFANNPSASPASTTQSSPGESSTQQMKPIENGKPTTNSTERELTVPYASSTRKARSVSIGLSHPITFGYAKQKPPQNNTNTNQPKTNPSSKFSSTTERVMKDVPEPTREVLTMNQVYNKDGKINCDLLKEHFRKEGLFEWILSLSLYSFKLFFQSERSIFLFTIYNHIIFFSSLFSFFLTFVFETDPSSSSFIMFAFKVALQLMLQNV
jgi:hypothetical protein